MSLVIIMGGTRTLALLRRASHGLIVVVLVIGYVQLTLLMSLHPREGAHIVPPIPGLRPQLLLRSVLGPADIVDGGLHAHPGVAGGDEGPISP